MNIRSYLTQVAAKITDASLKSIKTPEDWKREAPERRKIYLDRMGITPYLEAPRTPLNTTITGTVKRHGYRIERLHYQSLPQLYVTANLYIPDGLTAPTPAIAYFCGHSSLQKIHYQAHARRFCQLGFVTLIVDTLQYGEVKGEHHGCYSQGKFNWYSRGYSPAGLECWNGIRGLDLLCAHPEVDPKRIGVTGTSGGGAMSWWLGAADVRVAAVATSCGTGTLRSHLAETTIDNHCDCMFHINHDGWDLADIGALIAPRPLMISSADGDLYYKIESVRETFNKITSLYTTIGAGDRTALVTYPGPHAYSTHSRQRIFSWFLKHLAGNEVPHESIADYNPKADEAPEVLKVFTTDLPQNARNATIDGDFIPTAKLQAAKNREALEQRKTEVTQKLRRLTFSHFPTQEAPLALEIQQHLDSGNRVGIRFSYAGEADYRHFARLEWEKTETGPLGVVLALQNPREERGVTAQFIRGIAPEWATCVAATRGTGDLSWGEELSWHVRRGAAITGRTVSSLRVYDTLRTLAALRSFKNVRADRIVLAAQGEMVPVALYAALLDSRIHALILGNPPATQNVPSQGNGRGESIEMLSCLRITDLPEVAALLWPAKLIFMGARPDSYGLAEETYKNLGVPGQTQTVKSDAKIQLPT